MSVPVLLVTGYLGAGKTTMINRLLQTDHGERIAAIVNDFGAINVDAELLSDATDTVVGLKNGCICCTLQGDLLRTLRLVLAHDPPPERIIIEASGAADPRGIAEMVLDPVLWGVVSLDAVACLVDAEDIAADPARMDDPLWQAQVQHADFALLSKTTDLPAEITARLRARISLTGRTAIDLDAEGLPLDLLLGPGPDARPRPGPDRVHADRFVTMQWQSDRPLSMEAFQTGLQDLGQGLLRAKGWLVFDNRPDQTHLFQLVGRRASFSPAPHRDGAPPCQLVLIGEKDTFDPGRAARQLAAMVPTV